MLFLSLLLSSLLLCTEALPLLTALLDHQRILIEVLLELGSALDDDHETIGLADLDLRDLDVAPAREHVDDLCQLGHANLAVCLKLDLFVLVQVDHVLDDAQVLANWQAHSDDQHVGLVILEGLALSTLWLLLIFA